MSMGSQEKGMDVSMKKRQQNDVSPSPAVPELSPEARVMHRSPKRVFNGLLSRRNGHLEHPHFIEVQLPSSRDLSLKAFGFFFPYQFVIPNLKSAFNLTLFSWTANINFANTGHWWL
ncbi:hypothetical protein EJ110_NYTH15650 [Nymphaea thermarum]|nr:hypothetical protein EJ110_NYTH15650 [Nymphaea thermarum]